ncbi:hypothetical protein PG994_009014 [Apiospora phragmitis]|uniref:GST N-terminal domain-containing protein n=1 Tax=Apiospora phragmitis TaxID=2905665 RepID=A0ABR1UKF1_9PEZI
MREAYMKATYEGITVSADFVSDIAAYFAQLTSNPHDIHTLDDLREFTQRERREEYPDRDTAGSGVAEEPAAGRRRGGVSGLIARYNLSALVMPTEYVPTWTSAPGLPVITVPLGVYPPGTPILAGSRGLIAVAPGIPFGLAWLGKWWFEETLVALVGGYERGICISNLTSTITLQHDRTNYSEIVLYDLACTKNVCFSPVVWCARLMLNYKQIPYKTVFLEFPDIEPTLKELGLAPNETGHKYTVPAIQHAPTDTHLMGSIPIAQFLESTYPDRPVPLTSELGSEIGTRARAAVGPVLTKSLMPREVRILPPRAQEYFRRTREASIGRPLEDLLGEGTDEEQRRWDAVDEELRALGGLLQTRKAEGPFVLGARPSYTDFFIAGSLQCARTVDEGVFERIAKYPGFKDIYEACQPYMERKD